MADSEVLLAVDIGNSAVSYGFFRKRRLIGTGSIPTAYFPQFSIKLLSKWGRFSIDKVIICSVVPLVTHKIQDLLSYKRLQDKVYIIGKHVKLKVPMGYDRSSLGADRQVNVYGAIHRYRLPCLVIDYGTAITFDYISKSGIFKGGLIVPGIETSWSAMQKRAALLPKARRIRRYRSFIGRNTESAMLSGLLNGYGALSSGLIQRFRAQGRGKMTVVATGGFARLIQTYARGFDVVDPYHTIRSLALIYRDEVEEKS